MKMDNKKIIIILCVVVAILLGSVIGYNVYRTQKDKAYLNEMFKKIYDTVVDVSADIGISDIEVISIGRAVDDNGQEQGWYTSYVSSEQFGKLTEEQMLRFFSRLAYKADVSVAPYIGCTRDEYGGLRILSDGHEYMYYSDIGCYTLYKDGEKVYEDQWGNTSWDFSAFDEFYEKYGNKPSGDCTICKKTATEVFQGYNYCDEHYIDAVTWAFEKALEKNN